MERHWRSRPFAGSFTNLRWCTSSLASAKSTTPVQRQMRGGNILVLLRLTAAEERHLLLFLQPSSLGNGGACKRGSLGIVHLSSSSCYTANGSPCKQSCFTLRDKPACLRGCDIPTRWMPAPTRSLCWSRHEVEKGNVQDASRRGARTVALPGMVILNSHSSLVVNFCSQPLLQKPGGIPTAARGAMGNQCLGVWGSLALL